MKGGSLNLTDEEYFQLEDDIKFVADRVGMPDELDPHSYHEGLYRMVGYPETFNCSAVPFRIWLVFFSSHITSELVMSNMRTLLYNTLYNKIVNYRECAVEHAITTVRVCANLLRKNEGIKCRRDFDEK